MDVQIKPRKTTDRGGYLCMPLKRNVPIGREEWILTTCPKCGGECWDRPMPEGFDDTMFAGKLCTECALAKQRE